MELKKLILNIPSDFLRYISNTLLNNQHHDQDSEIPLEPLVTRAKNLTNKQDVLVVTLEQDTNS